MLRDGTMPVVRLSLCTMTLKMVPNMPPVSRARICKRYHRLSGCSSQCVPLTHLRRDSPAPEVQLLGMEMVVYRQTLSPQGVCMSRGPSLEEFSSYQGRAQGFQDSR